MTIQWEMKPLAAVCELISRGISPSYIEGSGIAVLNQKCVRDHTVSVELARRHNVEAKKVPADRYLRAGDVLVNSTGTGTLGRVAQLRAKPLGPTTVDSHVTIVRPTEGKFFPDFFGYALVYIEKQIQQGGEGCGGQIELSRSKLANTYQIVYPKDRNEQHRIASFLDEAFAGIDAVTANAEKNVTNARELFNSYLESVFVQKSKGWINTKLGDICENLDSRRIPITKAKRVSGRTPYYGASGIVDYVSGYLFDENILLISEDGANLLARTYPIAFSVSGKSWVNNHAHVVRFNRSETQRFVELYLNFISLIPYVSGMAQPKLNQKALNTILIPIPPFAEQVRIVETAATFKASVERLAAIHREKGNALARLKDAILHQAFAGTRTAQSSKAVQEVAE